MNTRPTAAISRQKFTVFEKLNTYIYLADFNFIPIEKVRNFAACGNRNVVNKKSLKLQTRFGWLTLHLRWSL